MSEPSASPHGALRNIGGYEILAKLGQGAMGAVYKAKQPGLDRVVALKVLPLSIAKDAKFIERFQREARASAALNHPNVVQGIDVGRDEASGLWYFAMEFVDGKTLRKMLDEERAIPERRALEYTRDVAHALECAEKHSFVHRDIKPDNILVPSNGVAKLADLGLAKRTESGDAHLTQSGQAVGTPHYMSPEQAKGLNDELDIRSDIYSLGATLFHLVTGKTPFEGPTGAVVMSKHITEKTPLAHRVAERVSEPCSRLIARMMHKQKEQRVQTPGELIEQIERLLNGQAEHATTRAVARVHGKPQEPVAAEPRGNAMLLAALGGGAALVVLLLVFMRGGGTQERKETAAKAAPPVPAVSSEIPAPARAIPKAAPPANPPPPVVAEKTAALPAPSPVVPLEAPPTPIAVAETKPEAKEAQAAPAKTEAPAVAAKEAPAANAADNAVYAKFSVEYLDILRKHDAAAATKRLTQAEGDAALKAFKTELAQDRQAIGWLSDLNKAVGAGALKLKDMDSFELRSASGTPTKVGKNEAMKFIEVKDEKIRVGAKGMDLPLPLALLSPATLNTLAEMGLGEDAHAALMRAFIALLSFGASPAAVPAPTAASVTAEIDKAKTAGAEADGVEWLKSKLGFMQQADRERRAATAWGEALKLEQAKRWKELLTALDAFEKNHADTQEGTSRKADLAKLRELALEEISKAEGLFFDFKTPENFATFKKLFAKTVPFSMELAHEPGRAIFRPYLPDKVQLNGGMHIQADSIKLGKNWELRYSVNLNLGAKEVAAHDNANQFGAYFHVRFMKAGELGTYDEGSHVRFHCSLISGYEGFFCCALRAHRQMGNGDGPQWPFQGMAKLGIAGGSYFQKGKVQEPAAADGRYKFVFERKDKHMRIEANQKVMVDENLPDEAAALLEESPLAFFIQVVNIKDGIFLEELRIKGVAKGK